MQAYIDLLTKFLEMNEQYQAKPTKVLAKQMRAVSVEIGKAGKEFRKESVESTR